MKIALALFVVCFAAVVLAVEKSEQEKQVLASLPPISKPSQSNSPSPRPPRTDFTTLTFSEPYVYQDRFDSFGSSFFAYFGISSPYGVDDEESSVDDDDFIFGDDDDGANDDGADDDDEEVVFNDVAFATTLLPSVILMWGVAIAFVIAH